MSVRSRKSTAAREVSAKSESTLERETAEKWTDRAEACWKKYEETGASEWLFRFENYRHEAIEHAALIGDGGKTVAKIEARLGTKAGRMSTRRRAK